MNQSAKRPESEKSFARRYKETLLAFALILIIDIGWLVFGFYLGTQGMGTLAFKPIVRLIFYLIVVSDIVLSIFLRRRLLRNERLAEYLKYDPSSLGNVFSTAYTASAAICQIGLVLGMLLFLANKPVYDFIILTLSGVVGLLVHLPRMTAWQSRVGAARPPAESAGDKGRL